MFYTLGGGPTVIDPMKGETRWTIADKLAIRVTSLSDMHPHYLPDPRGGSLYTNRNPRSKDSRSSLTRSAPCRSSDGILYPGKKRSDDRFLIDLKTSRREKVLGFGTPLDGDKTESIRWATWRTVYLGRTQYTVMMYDSQATGRNSKPWNVTYFDYTSHVTIKIIDFGLAQRLSLDTSVRVLLGTAEFVPPEIINYEPIGLQSDMWSIGVICYVLLSGLSPFMGESDVDTFNNITRAEYDFDDDAFQIVTNEAKDFISGLLQYRKEDRLSATQCLHTKWLSLDNDYLGKSKICTNKLKKFIIRRKWQKTGNAIRALGRMALLSASRRNSSVLSSDEQNNHLNE